MEPGDAEPIWTRESRSPLDGWPVRLRAGADLRYGLPLHAAWTGPELSAAGPAVVHAYRGRSPAEWATVAFIRDPDPAADLVAWVEGMLALTGFPVSPPFRFPSLSLLEWDLQGRSPALADRLAVADTRCYAGLAAIADDDGPALMRLYVLLARDETSAWNVALAFESACPPGSDAAFVVANDHVRAATTFGGLRLG